MSFIHDGLENCLLKRKFTGHGLMAILVFTSRLGRAIQFAIEIGIDTGL